MLFQFVLSTVIFATAWLVWRRFLQQAVGLAIAILWMLGSIAALVITWYPDTASLIANFVGIGRGADLVVYLGLACLFVLVFQLHVSHVRLERQLTKLVREHSLSKLDSCPRGNEKV